MPRVQRFADHEKIGTSRIASAIFKVPEQGETGIVTSSTPISPNGKPPTTVSSGRTVLPKSAQQRVNSDTPADSESRGLPRWTFLTNHSHVLVLLHAEPDVVLREVAVHVGITERAVQRIIQDLESGGFIERERVGRRNHYRVLTDEPLRHPIEAHRTIGDLLALISRDQVQDR